MQSFDMLYTYPITDNGQAPESSKRYYIDGVRVSAKEYLKLSDACARHDTFHSYRKGERYFNRKVSYR